MLLIPQQSLYAANVDTKKPTVSKNLDLLAQFKPCTPFAYNFKRTSEPRPLTKMSEYLKSLQNNVVGARSGSLTHHKVETLLVNPPFFSLKNAQFCVMDIC